MFILQKPANKLQFVLLLLFSIQTITTMGQIKVKFQSKDDITITADCYKVDESSPYILLFHQAGSSRGEYKEIAGKLTNLGYNCLAVDLRSGNEVNNVVNETARRLP